MKPDYSSHYLCNGCGRRIRCWQLRTRMHDTSVTYHRRCWLSRPQCTARPASQRLYIRAETQLHLQRAAIRPITVLSRQSTPRRPPLIPPADTQPVLHGRLFEPARGRAPLWATPNFGQFSSFRLQLPWGLRETLELIQSDADGSELPV